MSSAEVDQDRSGYSLSGPAIFVWGVGIVMLVGALGFLSRFAVNVPFAEDGTLIPYVTGTEPLDKNFLWFQYNSHFMPLPKLVLVLLARFTHDFRTSMYVSVLSCAVLALVLTFTAKSLRGRFDYCDAFFALGLLHLGHWETFLIGFAIMEVMSAGLLTLVLLVILRSGAVLTARQSLLVGACLVILPTTGTAGLLLVPPLAVWLMYSAWVSWRAGGPGAGVSAVLQLALVLAAFAAMLPYYFNPPQGIPWLRGPASQAEKIYAHFLGLMQILTLGFGVGAASPWLPFLKGDRSVLLVGSVVLCLVAAALVVLLVRRQPPAERLRRVGLVCYLLANLLLLAGIAYGRSGVDKMLGLSSRYALYSVPLLWGVYFTWQLYGPRLGNRLVPVGLFAFTCAMFSLNMNQGYLNGEIRHATLKAAERDIVKVEVPASTIVDTYYQFIFAAHWACYETKGSSDKQVICSQAAEMINMLRQANIPKRNHLDPRP